MAGWLAAGAFVAFLYMYCSALKMETPAASRPVVAAAAAAGSVSQDDVELQKGRKTNLTEQNIRLLHVNEIGFRWQTNTSPAKKPSEVSESEAVATAAAAAAATAPAEPYQSMDMTTDEAHGLLALSGYPDFGANI